MDLKSTFGLSALRDRATTTGSGTVTNTVGDAEFSLRVGGSGGSAELRTVERGRYVSGTCAEVGVACRIAATSYPLTGNQQLRCGYCDVDNGFFFRYDAAGAAVVVRRDRVETVVPSSAWNVDRMDGTGPSLQTLDPTVGIIHQILYTWYGYAAIEFRIVVTAGEQGRSEQYVQPVHRFAPTGETSVKNPNLPLYVELLNENVPDPTTEPAIEAYVGGRQYSILGKVSDTSVRTTSVYRLLYDVSTPFTAILSVRRKANYIGNPVCACPRSR